MSSLLVGLSAALLFIGIGSVQALMQPIGSGYDEPAHLVKAVGTAHGQWYGTGTAEYRGDVYPVFSVPFLIACTNLAKTPEACRTQSQTSMVDVVSTVGYYNPTYYAIAGIPSLFLAGEALPYAMRLWSVVIVSVLAGGAFAFLASLRRGPTLIAMTLLVFTPLFFFTLGEVNPTAMEVVCAFGLMAVLLAITDGPNSGGPGRWFALLIYGGLLANVRSLGVGWALLTVLIVFIGARHGALGSAFSRRTPRVASAAALLVCTLALLQLGSSGVLRHFIPVTDGLALTPMKAFETMLRRTVFYFNGMVGREGLASAVLSHRASLALFVPLAAAWIVGLWRANTLRRRVALVASAAALLLAPPILQAPGAHDQGLIWQPRYSLAMFAALFVYMLFCALSPRSHARHEAVVQWVLTVGALGTFGALQIRSVVNFSRIWASLPWEGVLASKGIPTVQPIDPGTAYPLRSILVVTLVGLMAVGTSLVLAERETHISLRIGGAPACPPIARPEDESVAEIVAQGAETHGNDLRDGIDRRSPRRGEEAVSEVNESPDQTRLDEEPRDQ